MRRDLRTQIGRLDAELGMYAHEDRDLGGPGTLALVAAPRLLDAAELERARDRLIARLGAARAEAGRRGLTQQAARARVEEMIRDPSSFRRGVVTAAETGDADCRRWRVVPRFGPIGALAGWWRVKVSSGCPLVGPLAAVFRSARRGSYGPGGAPVMLAVGPPAGCLSSAMSTLSFAVG